MTDDPYVINERTVKEPPQSFWSKLLFLGPGFILSASIVGSGELIATTILGATAGYSAMWIIIVSCLAKVAVQLEFGKHAILTGETAMKSFSRLPGPRFGKGKWTVWAILILVGSKVVQLGGMVGGTAIILGMLFPVFSIPVWTVLTGAVSALLIYNGKYKWIERLSLAMIAAFTVFTLIAVYALKFTPYHFSFAEVIRAQVFNLSPAIAGVAIGAFGITGVASDEIIAYNYWCLEKGYAAFAGPRNETDAWKKRAKGWINVMYLDAVMAMIIYTAVTIAFYLLGAAVLYNRGEVPAGNEVIETIALIYTQSLGPGVKNIYLVGGFFVLFSSVYATLAAWTRLFSDIAGQMNWLDFNDLVKRKKFISMLAVVAPALWVIAYLFIELPVLMVLSGGILGSVILLIVVFAALNFRYKGNLAVKPGLFYDAAFWISVISILGVAVFGIAKIFQA